MPHRYEASCHSGPAESTMTEYEMLEALRVADGTYYKLGFYDYVADNLTWFGTDKWIGEI